MPGFIFDCPRCGRDMEVEGNASRPRATVKCPFCKRMVPVPAEIIETVQAERARVEEERASRKRRDQERTSRKADKERAKAERATVKQSREDKASFQGVVGAIKEPGRRRLLLLVAAAFFCVAILVLVVVKAGGGGPSGPLTVSQACRTLEKLGWSFKDDQRLELTQIRLVTYEKQAGDLRVNACIMPDYWGNAVQVIELGVWGPYVEGEAGVQQAERAFQECRLAADSLLPSCTMDIKRAIAFSREVDDSDQKFPGDARFQGEATSKDGWLITYAGFVAFIPSSDRNCYSKLLFSKMEQERAQ